MRNGATHQSTAVELQRYPGSGCQLGNVRQFSYLTSRLDAERRRRTKAQLGNRLAPNLLRLYRPDEGCRKKKYNRVTNKTLRRHLFKPK